MSELTLAACPNCGGETSVIDSDYLEFDNGGGRVRGHAKCVVCGEVTLFRQLDSESVARWGYLVAEFVAGSPDEAKDIASVLIQDGSL